MKRYLKSVSSKTKYYDLDSKQYLPVEKKLVSFTIWDIIFYFLKICFLIMLVIFLFRHSLGGQPMTFSEFLNAIPTIGYDSNGVSYFESMLQSLNVREFFEPTDIDVIIIGDLVNFMSVVIGLVTYVCSALFSSVMYFVDLLGLIF